MSRVRCPALPRRCAEECDVCYGITRVDGGEPKPRNPPRKSMVEGGRRCVFLVTFYEEVRTMKPAYINLIQA